MSDQAGNLKGQTLLRQGDVEEKQELHPQNEAQRF
jgi:hypothetical protein